MAPKANGQFKVFKDVVDQYAVAAGFDPDRVETKYLSNCLQLIRCGLQLPTNCWVAIGM